MTSNVYYFKNAVRVYAAESICSTVLSFGLSHFQARAIHI